MTPLRTQLRDAIGDTVGRGHARARIIDAAVDTFAKRGVAATSVEDILVASDVSRRTFYQHFDDKFAVVHAIFELVTTQLATMFTAAVARTTEPLAAIDDALSIFLELHHTDRAIMRALIEESMRAESPLFGLRMQFRRAIMTTLDAMVVARTAKKLDPYVALALVSAVEGISLELLTADSTEADIARAKAVIAALIALVCAHPGELPARRRA